MLMNVAYNVLYLISYGVIWEHLLLLLLLLLLLVVLYPDMIPRLAQQFQYDEHSCQCHDSPPWELFVLAWQQLYMLLEWLGFRCHHHYPKLDRT